METDTMQIEIQKKYKNYFQEKLESKIIKDKIVKVEKSLIKVVHNERDARGVF